MNQQILLGVDMDLSPATHAMLQLARTFLVQLAPQSQALLLTVIPVPYDTPSSLGRFRGQAPCLSATTVQRTEARHTLQLAQAVLVQGGIAPRRLETQVCEGVPAEELVKVATERQVACIVLGYSRHCPPTPDAPALAGKYHRSGLAQGTLPGPAGAEALESHSPGRLV